MEQNIVKTKTQYSFACLLFVISILSWAQTKNSEAHFNLFTYDQFGKVQVIKDIKVSKDKIYVDGAPLSSTENMIKAKYLKKLVESKGGLKEINCSTGNFIFRKSVNGLDTVENGCLDTKRYKDLNLIFDQFRKDVVLK